jgi:hypothetical protein
VTLSKIKFGLAGTAEAKRVSNGVLPETEITLFMIKGPFKVSIGLFSL